MWNNPPDSDYTYVEVYVGGEWNANVEDGNYTAEFEDYGTYEISFRAVDKSSHTMPVAGSMIQWITKRRLQMRNRPLLTS